MALGLLLQSSLITFLLLTSSIGQRNDKVPVYRLSQDTRNLEDVHHDYWIKPDDGSDNKVRKEDLSDDDSDPIDEDEDGDLSSSKVDVSWYNPTGDSSVFPNRLVTSSPPDVERLVNSNAQDHKLQDGDKPLTFPLNPDLRPQVASSDRTLLWHIRQSPSHPYANNRHVSQSTFYPSSNAPYSWSPVLSNRFYRAGPQKNNFRPSSIERGDSTRPYFYNQKHFHYPLDNNYGGTLNRLGIYEPKKSPTGYPANTHPVYVPEGQGQSFSQRNYASMDYRPRYDQMHIAPREPVISSQPSPQRGRKLIPRYVIQSRNGYQTKRYFASEMFYDPGVN